MSTYIKPIGTTTSMLFPVSKPPMLHGRYLLLSYEWVGTKEKKPELPEWNIRTWNGNSWERKKYFFDTGGMEEFENVAWCCLPSRHL